MTGHAVRRFSRTRPRPAGGPGYGGDRHDARRGQPRTAAPSIATRGPRATATSVGPAELTAAGHADGDGDAIDWSVLDHELVHQQLDPGRRPIVAGIPVSVDTEAALLARIQDAVSTGRPTVFVGLYAAPYRSLARDSAHRAAVGLRRAAPTPTVSGWCGSCIAAGARRPSGWPRLDMAHPVPTSPRPAAGGWA